MKAKCRFCGDNFSLNREDAQMVENGEIDLPKICDECFDMQESNHHEEECRSDADMGL